MSFLDKLMGRSEAGAGRGFVNPKTVGEMAAEKRTPQQNEAIQEAKDAADRKKIKDMGYKKGGSVSSASARADGIAMRGKTRGKIC
jgi:hypothetical protein